MKWAKNKRILNKSFLMIFFLDIFGTIVQFCPVHFNSSFAMGMGSPLFFVNSLMIFANIYISLKFEGIKILNPFPKSKIDLLGEFKLAFSFKMFIFSLLFWDISSEFSIFPRKHRYFYKMHVLNKNFFVLKRICFFFLMQLQISSSLQAFFVFQYNQLFSVYVPFLASNSLHFSLHFIEFCTVRVYFQFELFTFLWICS